MFFPAKRSKFTNSFFPQSTDCTLYSLNLLTVLYIPKLKMYNKRQIVVRYGLFETPLWTKFNQTIVTHLGLIFFGPYRVFVLCPSAYYQVKTFSHSGLYMYLRIEIIIITNFQLKLFYGRIIFNELVQYIWICRKVIINNFKVVTYYLKVII